MEYFSERKVCPVCKHSAYTVLLRSGFLKEPINTFLCDYFKDLGGVNKALLEDAEYVLVRCNNCEFVYQQNVPNENLMKILYGSWIDPDMSFERRRKLDTLDYYLFKSHEIVTMLRYLKKPSSEVNVFDFGMGWGKWLYFAQSFGCNIYGSELSQERIDYAQKRGIHLVNVKDDITTKFDIINSDQVFEHISDPRELLERLVSLLLPGGLIKLSVPNSSNALQRIKKHEWEDYKSVMQWIDPIKPLEHINSFTHNSLLRLGKECGLTQVKIPVSYYWKSLNNFSNTSEVLKGFYRPMKINWLNQGTYVFFTHSR